MSRKRGDVLLGALEERQRLRRLDEIAEQTAEKRKDENKKHDRIKAKARADVLEEAAELVELRAKYVTNFELPEGTIFEDLAAVIRAAKDNAMTDHTPMTEVNETCESCYFWDNSTCLGGNQATGMCHARPPQVDMRNSRGVWPFTEDVEWCGAWKAKEPIP